MSNSFSSTPSSRSCSDFDAIACSSRGVTNPAGCLSGVLRRILCSGSLPTYPSDCGLMVSKNQEKCSSPGVVARLMGLDSLPDFSRQDDNQLTRSRSVNSVGNSGTCDQGHRRGKSSVPIHVMPTFLELEDENFLVLSFEDLSKGEEFSSKERNCEKGFRESKQRRGKCRRNKEIGKEKQGVKNVPSQTEFSQDVTESNVDSTIRSLLTPKNFVVTTPLAVEAEKKSGAVKYVASDGSKMRMKVNKAGQECSSEDSSPVSVLDYDQYITDPEYPKSVQVSRLANLGSRRKLSSELEHYVDQYPQDDNSLNSDEREIEKAKYVPLTPWKVDCHNRKKYMEKWGEICRLAREDIIGSDWICREVSKLDDYASISTDFGRRILDHLLDELIDQLSGLHMKL